MRRLFHAPELVKAGLSPEASFRLQIPLLPPPKLALSIKKEKRGCAKKAEPPNWPSSLSRKLAPPVRRAGHQIYVRASGGEGFDQYFHQIMSNLSNNPSAHYLTDYDNIHQNEICVL